MSVNDFSDIRTRLAHKLKSAAQVTVFICLFGLSALLLHDFTAGVQYRVVPVVSVTQVPGMDISERLVVVDLGHRHWPIRTSDRLLRVQTGDMACLESREVLLRRWVSRRLALPGYCRALRRESGGPKG